MAQVVLQSDFGLSDGAVCAMRGVIYGVDPALTVVDLTHDIPAFSRWDASYRLFQACAYWPAGTVFVSVVDPGVGSDRKSAVAALSGGTYVVTPDNGTLCHLQAHNCIKQVRQIDETHNRVQGSEQSHTFHGRDVYGYTAARLAAGVITFEQVGPAYPPAAVVTLPLDQPTRSDRLLVGSADITDVHFGNVWSNIPVELFESVGYRWGDLLTVLIRSRDRDRVLYSGTVPFGRSFFAVAIGAPVLYANSIGYISIALNQANFAATHDIDVATHPVIELSPAQRPGGSTRAT